LAKKVQKSVHKLDIFDVLNAISTKDVHFFSKLSPEEQKSIQPFVLQRWLTGGYDPLQTILINEVVNPYVFEFYQHPQLMWMLMTICTSGKPTRYRWIRAQQQKYAHPNTLEVIKQFFSYSTKEANDALPLLSDDDIINYAEQLGYQTDEIKAIKKELTNR